MTTRKEWLADRKAFLTLLSVRDPEGDLPLALRLDLTPAQVEIMAPGVEDFDEKRALCTQWVQNFLSPEVERMERYLDFMAKARG